MSGQQTKNKSIFPVFLSGYPCSGRCIYCNAAVSSGFHSPPDFETLEKQLEQWLARTPAQFDREIAWYGNDLPDIPESAVQRLLSICRRVSGSGPAPTLRISLRPDSVIATPAHVLSIFSIVELGVPSMDPKVLRTIRRNHGPDVVADATVHLRSLGIRTGFQTMMGLPGADAASDRESAETLAALKPDFVRIHPTLVLNGTALAEMTDAGDYVPMPLEEAVERCVDAWDIYEANRIPVIRCGFHLPEAERVRALHAGPWHPAFGQLVRSRRWRRRLDSYLANHPATTVICVAHEDFSDAVGHGKENLRWLQEKHGREVVVLKVES